MSNLDPRTKRTLSAYRDALTRLLRKKPLEQITVSELSSLAGYHRSTFYRHYNHVAELFAEIQEEMLSEFETILARHPTQKADEPIILGRDTASTIRILSDAFMMIKRNATFASVILSNPLENQLLRRLLQSGRHYALDSDNSKLDERDAEYYDRYYTFLTGGFIATIQRWLEEGMVMSAEELARLCNEFIALGATSKV